MHPSLVVHVRQGHRGVLDDPVKLRLVFLVQLRLAHDQSHVDRGEEVHHEVRALLVPHVLVDPDQVRVLELLAQPRLELERLSLGGVLSLARQQLLHGEPPSGTLLRHLHHARVLTLQKHADDLVTADPVFTEDIDVRGQGMTSRSGAAKHEGSEMSEEKGLPSPNG